MSEEKGMRSRVLGGLGWTGASELVMQITRMIAAITLARLLARELAVLGRCRRRQVLEQVGRRVRDRLDGLVEGLLVGLAGLGAPADLPDVLQRGGTDLVAGRGRLEVVELADVAAHISQASRRKVAIACCSVQARARVGGV